MTPSGLVAHTLEESFSPALHFVRDCGGQRRHRQQRPSAIFEKLGIRAVPCCRTAMFRDLTTALCNISRLNAIIRLVDAQWTVNIRVGSSTASSGEYRSSYEIYWKPY